jgi:2',5'-phosphodiesterase
LRATNATAAPPLDALTAETALPNSEFPSDHIPMVADLEFASE